MHGYLPHVCLFHILVRRGLITHKVEVMDNYKSPCKYWQLSLPNYMQDRLSAGTSLLPHVIMINIYSADVFFVSFVTCLNRLSL